MRLLSCPQVFSAEEKVLVEGGDPQTLVKVTNSKHRISTYWTWTKFEERLLQMQDLYQVRLEAADLIVFALRSCVFSNLKQYCTGDPTVFIRLRPFLRVQ